MLDNNVYCVMDTETTGSGLSIVHGIVVAHNGAINVESAVNKGTKFTIELPKS